MLLYFNFQTIHAVHVLLKKTKVLTDFDKHTTETGSFFTTGQGKELQLVFSSSERAYASMEGSRSLGPAHGRTYSSQD
jgi:hypothetical protein